MIFRQTMQTKLWQVRKLYIRLLRTWREGELTDEWVAKNTDYTTVDDYRESIRSELEKNAKESAQEVLKNTAWSTVLENSEVKEYPQEDVDKAVSEFKKSMEVYAFRSTGDSHAEIARVFDREVVPLRLVDPRFYHLDTAISVLDPVEGLGGVEKANIAYLPSAFDDDSRRILEERYPDAILVDDADGAVFGLNSASDGYNVFISPRATGFEAQLRERGYNPVLVDLSELLLGGGGIKCCTPELRGKR